MSIRSFTDRHYRHFNAATVVDTANAWEAHLNDNGHVLVTLAGAMSTAELGRSLAEMIRQQKVHAICCTGANLEEDIFNLVAHKYYVRVPDYRQLSPQDEKELERQGLNRVTDTCIPEEEAFRAIEHHILEIWQEADRTGGRLSPPELMRQLVQEKLPTTSYQIDPKDSWILAAIEHQLPIFVPGWEDSTLGNIFAAHCMRGTIRSAAVMRSGIETMHELADWYVQTTMGKAWDALPEIEEGQTAVPVPREEAVRTIGFFQIGGGIAGAFPICVVPMIRQDLGRSCPYWGWFCQISDSTTSYGSYSGAVPNEKITWGKLDIDTPRFIIESDASIVAPLIFGRLLGW